MNLPQPTDVRRIGILGAGTIGASWTAFFLSRGMEVTVYDPAAQAEQMVRQFIAKAWPTLEALGLAPGADSSRVRFVKTPPEAVREAQFVQESGPERVADKVALYSQIDEALPENAILASSTSGLLMSELQQGRVGRERYVVGHPFNPPHLMPLVEVVGGHDTDPATVDWAVAFYNAHGKRAIRVNREIPGHIANRLQAALWREAVDLVASGAASAADVDAAVAFGPGLRWALMGPHLIFHLGGGEGGMRHFIEHLGPAFESWWRDLGDPKLTKDVAEKLVAGVEQEAAGRSVTDLSRQRDALLVAVLKAIKDAQGQE